MLYLLALAGALGDAVSTHVALRRGCREMNGAVNWLMRAVSVDLALAITVLVKAAFCWQLLDTAYLASFVAIQWAVVLWNTWQSTRN